MPCVNVSSCWEKRTSCAYSIAVKTHTEACAALRKVCGNVENKVQYSEEKIEVGILCFYHTNTIK